MRKKIQISYFLRVTQLLQLTGSTYNFVIKKLRWDGCFTVTLAHLGQCCIQMYFGTV